MADDLEALIRRLSPPVAGPAPSAAARHDDLVQRLERLEAVEQAARQREAAAKIGKLVTELLRMVAVQQLRLKRLSEFAAERCHRITVLRAEHKTEIEQLTADTNDRVLEVMRAWNADRARHGEGRVVEVYTDGQRQFGTLEFTGGEAVQSLASLFDAVYHAPAESAAGAVEIPADTPMTAGSLEFSPGKRVHVSVICEGSDCGHARLMHRWTPGAPTSCTIDGCTCDEFKTPEGYTFHVPDEG
jgi:hypothetical protein